MHHSRWPLAVLALLACAAPARRAAGSPPEEQVEEAHAKPISFFAVDARGAWARFKAHPELAEIQTETVSRGLGFGLGLHVYPLRTGSFALGLGGELVATNGGRTPGPDDFPGPRVTTTFRSLTPQLSLNFGNREGWSYISAGFGNSSYYVQAEGTNLANDPDARLKTINLGVGARWFWNAHMALCVDLRLYRIDATSASAPDATGAVVFGTPRTNLLVIGAGFSFH